MYYQVQNDADWQMAVTLIEGILVQRIKHRVDPMSYTELVNEINPQIRRPRLDLESQGDRSALSALLGAVGERCRARNQPMLSAFVVLKETLMPGYGWWDQARLAGHPVETEDQKIVAFTKEYNDCVRFYSQPSYVYQPSDNASLG